MKISLLCLLAANAVFASPIVKRQVESSATVISEVLTTEVVPASTPSSDMVMSLPEATASATDDHNDDDSDSDSPDSTMAPSASASSFEGEFAYPCPAGSRLLYVENQTNVNAALETVIEATGYFWNSTLFNVTMPTEAPEEVNMVGETRQVSLGVNGDLSMEVLTNATTDTETLALQLEWNSTESLTVLLAEVPSYATVQQIYLNETESTEDAPVTTVKLFSNICAAEDNDAEILDFFQLVFGSRLSAVAEGIELATDPVDVPTTIANNGGSALVDFLVANLPEVAQTLATTPNITVFAPNNEAVAAVASALMSLPSDAVATAIQQHVVSGQYLAADITDGLSLPTLAGNDMVFTVNDTGVFVAAGGAEAQVVDTNFVASNGIVHFLNAVLVDAPASALESATSAIESAAASATSSAVEAAESD